ncbi:MAG: hypothetical protein H6Q25_290 [Bacteroidetes bacterium]|nr:hypothetical protein [Bacteroidota bacterium]
MKKILFPLLLICLSNIIHAQIHEVINGDERYMICMQKGFGLHCFSKPDLENGKWIFYYDSTKTKVKYIEYFKDRKRNGFSYWYREDGSINSLDEYKNGKFHGEFRGYHKNGQLRSKGFFYNNNSIGVFNAFDSLGNIIRCDTIVIPDGIQYRKIFVPETIVNKIFILNSEISDDQLYNNIEIDSLQNQTTIYFCNIHKNQYFTIKLNENKRIACFEIGFINPLLSENYINLNVPFFQTENEIKLGMTRNQLLGMKGTDFYVMTEKYIRYILDLNGNALTKQNEPIGYMLECEFENDKVVKIIFRN